MFIWYHFSCNAVYPRTLNKTMGPAIIDVVRYMNYSLAFFHCTSDRHDVMHSSSIFYNTNWVCMQQNLIFYLQMFSKTLVCILPIVLCVLSNLISIALFYRLLKQDATELASLSNLNVSVFCLWSYNRPYAILGAWLCSIDARIL